MHLVVDSLDRLLWQLVDSDSAADLRSSAAECQDMAAGCTTIMDICDGVNRLIWAPVAGPLCCHGFYMFIALGTIAWFLYSLHHFFAVTVPRPIIEVETLYQQTIPYPDIYFCLPGQVVYAALQANSGYYQNSYGITPRTLQKGAQP